MGFRRTPQPHVIAATKGLPVVVFIGEREIADLMPLPDPFNVADRCLVNPTGHDGTMSCGEVACPHCAFWP